MGITGPQPAAVTHMSKLFDPHCLVKLRQEKYGHQWGLLAFHGRPLPRSEHCLQRSLAKEKKFLLYRETKAPLVLCEGLSRYPWFSLLLWTMLLSIPCPWVEHHDSCPYKQNTEFENNKIHNDPELIIFCGLKSPPPLPATTKTLTWTSDSLTWNHPPTSLPPNLKILFGLKIHLPQITSWPYYLIKDFIYLQ